MLQKMRQSQKTTATWIIAMLLLLALSSLRFLWSTPLNGKYVELCTSKGSQVVWIDINEQHTSTSFTNKQSAQTTPLIKDLHHSNNPLGHCPFCLIGLLGLTLPISLCFLRRTPLGMASIGYIQHALLSKLIQVLYQSRAPPSSLFV